MRIIKASHVRRRVARLDAGGKHGRPFTVGRVKNEPHVLVRVPLGLLDAIDPGNKARVARYAARSTPLPAVLASYSERSCRRGIAQLFVWNGNHRVAAARLRGQREIAVLVPRSDWQRWHSCRQG